MHKCVLLYDLKDIRAGQWWHAPLTPVFRRQMAVHEFLKEKWGRIMRWVGGKKCRMNLKKTNYALHDILNGNH